MKDEKLNIDWELISSVLDNSADSKELKQFESWLENQENRQYFDEIKANWTTSGNLRHCYNDETNAAWKKVSGRTVYKKAKVRKIKARVFQMAAAILVLFAIGIATLTHDKQELISENIIINNYFLPDSSQVSLNRNSRLQFRNGLKGKKRELWLEGEAFFDVKRNPEKPFVIHIGNNLVEVLGTAFNVKEDANKQSIELNVERGKVRFKSNDIARSLIVEKGEAISYNRKKKELIKLTETNLNYLSWKTRIFKFNETLLSEVVAYLESAYDKKIIIRSKDLEELKFSASFNNQSLEKVLKVIALSLNIELKYVNETIELHKQEN